MTPGGKIEDDNGLLKSSRFGDAVYRGVREGWFVSRTRRFSAKPRCENGCGSGRMALAAVPHLAAGVVAGAIDDAEVRR